MIFRLGPIVGIIQMNVTYLGEKLSGDCGKYRTEFINKFIHIANKCMPIDAILEKRCIKNLWNLINSQCKLHNNIEKLSLNNVSTTIGENIRYFIYIVQIRFKK